MAEFGHLDGIGGQLDGQILPSGRPSIPFRWPICLAFLPSILPFSAFCRALFCRLDGSALYMVSLCNLDGCFILSLCLSAVVKEFLGSPFFHLGGSLILVTNLRPARLGLLRRIVHRQRKVICRWLVGE